MEYISSSTCVLITSKSKNMRLGRCRKSGYLVSIHVLLSSLQLILHGLEQLTIHLRKCSLDLYAKIALDILQRPCDLR
jgi:hypothetical protein